jgi:hypothetical protein
MVYVEQFGSDTFHIKGLTEDKAISRYELIELLRDIVNQGIDPKEFLDSETLQKYCSNDEEGLF